jgi:NarL family two-component system response regulator LiaR
LSNEEIANALAIGLETVKTHVHKLLRKMAMRDRTQVAVWAVKNGVV